jgi:hypothetical protein
MIDVLLGCPEVVRFIYLLERRLAMVEVLVVMACQRQISHFLSLQ